MLDKEDLNLILKEIQNQKYQKVIDIKLPQIEFKEDISNNISKNNFVFIDSSYITGVVGYISYIFARAVGISYDRMYILKDFISIPESYVNPENTIESLSIGELGEMLSKALEYKIAKESDGIPVIDGSLLSDAILFGKRYKFFENNIQKRYDEFLKNFEHVFKKGLITIAKRIVGGNFFACGSQSDFIILLNKFEDNEFYVGPFIRDLKQKQSEFPYKINAIYFRARKGDHIYRMEYSEFLDEKTATSFLYTEVYKNKRYPRGLKLAHNRCKIVYKEKIIVEDIIKSSLGLSNSFGWETK